jgi:hypothetical protein
MNNPAAPVAEKLKIAPETELSGKNAKSSRTGNNATSNQLMCIAV